MQWIGFHLIRMLSIGMNIKEMDTNGMVCNGMDSNAMDSNGFVAGVGCVVSGAVTGRDEPLRRWALRTGRRRAGLLGPAESGEVRQKLALAPLLRTSVRRAIIGFIAQLWPTEITSESTLGDPP